VTSLWEETLPDIQDAARRLSESIEVVACITDEGPEYFDDDIHTTCADCGVGIRHRPWIPPRPKKVCLRCAVKRSEDDEEAEVG
jgi:hypothetical protein